MSLGVLRGIGTLLLLLAFVGLCVWAYSKRQKQRWDESAQLPFLADRAEGAASPDAERESRHE